MTKLSPTKEVTFSPAALKAVIDEAVALALAATAKAVKGKAPAKPKAATSNRPSSADLEAMAIRTFAAAGYKDVQPRKNVLTFKKWMELGRRPSEGSKALKVGHFRLWHIDQTRELSSEETANAKTQLAASELRKNGKPELELM